MKIKREGEKVKFKSYQNWKKFCYTRVRENEKERGKGEIKLKTYKEINFRAGYYNSGILGTKYSKGLHKKSGIENIELKLGKYEN